MKPRLPAANIYVLLANTGLILNDNKILNQPEQNRQLFFEVLSHLVKLCMHVQSIKSDKIEAEAADLIDHVKHQQAIKFFNQFAIINTFLRGIEVGKFLFVEHYVYVDKQLSDRMLNELLRYYNYKMDALNQIESQRDQVEKLETLIAIETKGVEALKQSQEHLIIDKEIEAPRYYANLDQINIKQARILTIRTNKLEKIPIKDELSIKLQALNKENERLKLQLINIKQSTSQLNSKVTKNPQQVIQQKRRQIELQKRLLKNAQEERVLNQTKVDVVDKICKDYDKSYQQLFKEGQQYMKNFEQKKISNDKLEELQKQEARHERDSENLLAMERSDKNLDNALDEQYSMLEAEVIEHESRQFKLAQMQKSFIKQKQSLEEMIKRLKKEIKVKEKENASMNIEAAKFLEKIFEDQKMLSQKIEIYTKSKIKVLQQTYKDIIYKYRDMEDQE